MHLASDQEVVYEVYQKPQYYTDHDMIKIIKGNNQTNHESMLNIKFQVHNQLNEESTVSTSVPR